MPIKISIIIPLYNQHKKLLECLESIKNQNHPLTPFPRNTRDRLLVKEGKECGVEVIVVNDGSTDITSSELDDELLNGPRNGRRPLIGVADRLVRGRVIHQENQGAPSARNRGFKESTGEYVIFCDADVVMREDMLEKMNRVLDENPNASYAYSSFKFGWKKFKLWEFSANRLKQMPYIHTTSLIRREHFPGFDPSLKRLQDWDLWLTMLLNGYEGKWINEILFTVKSGGTISKWLPSFFSGFDAKYKDAVRIIKQKHNL
ncbi:MAG: hypothetical protein COV79_02695 [Parcubacteria group bacterium CG11_big_fil_rev_8_21_14_0_20_41_14]|nr:MAG: hypothetical protein COV79_02695 [Parcubacteria group bacterium CG11_big_fil_rev_8_21_14_0_20_41_14]PIR57029.1 MAG: hypothetical protein COU72_03090 [Parcubacteria group bacterium CG10_big_fil_rev_8_21_14_0_10_41_35]